MVVKLDKDIYVYDGSMSQKDLCIGVLHSSKTKGRENFSFEYSNDYLQEQEAFQIDLSLPLYPGRQYPPYGKTLFGIFEDSCPDRWGRVLMKRRENIHARKENRKPSLLTESDYLTGVCDETRMGALRFKLSPDGDFVSSDTRLATPPWTELRTLETASLEFENNQNPDEIKWLRQLLSPGSSLGGARPKANVLAPDDSLWIAKFPSRHDELNIGAWEMLAHDLAVKCGLQVPDAKIAKFSKYGSTFLVKRFDREHSERLHFVSAMAALGKSDGDTTSSYLDIAEHIQLTCKNPDDNLKELWHRIVFSMAVSNTDDHLRNHGFLYKDGEWKLSPLYDVNPVSYGDWLQLAVDGIDNSIDFTLAVDASESYGFNKDQAAADLRMIASTVKESWRPLAEKYGIPRSEILQMSPAFYEAEKGLAKFHVVETIKEKQQQKSQLKESNSVREQNYYSQERYQ